jgi:hypothetical protein
MSIPDTITSMGPMSFSLWFGLNGRVYDITATKEKLSSNEVLYDTDDNQMGDLYYHIQKALEDCSFNPAGCKDMIIPLSAGGYAHVDYWFEAEGVLLNHDKEEQNNQIMDEVDDFLEHVDGNKLYNSDDPDWEDSDELADYMNGNVDKHWVMEGVDKRRIDRARGAAERAQAAGMAHTLMKVKEVVEGGRKTPVNVPKVARAAIFSPKPVKYVPKPNPYKRKVAEYVPKENPYIKKRR